MATMNNTINTTNRPAYIPLRTTALNGDGWDLHLDISPLTNDEIIPALNYLLTGKMDEKYKTPKMGEYIQGVYDSCVESLLDFCFEWGVYDHCYTIDLLLTTMELNWCCEHCCTNEIEQLELLNQELMNGNWGVMEQIKARLTKFFTLAQPFVFETM